MALAIVSEFKTIEMVPYSRNWPTTNNAEKIARSAKTTAAVNLKAFTVSSLFFDYSIGMAGQAPPYASP
jgi:hypothetical protein